LPLDSRGYNNFSRSKGVFLLARNNSPENGSPPGSAEHKIPANELDAKATLSEPRSVKKQFRISAVTKKTKGSAKRGGRQPARGRALVPLWLESDAPGVSSGQSFASPELGCAFVLPAYWNVSASPSRAGPVMIGVFRGENAEDWFVASFMTSAVPGHDMTNWVRPVLALTGFPELALQPLPTLLGWEACEVGAAYASRLGLDEVHTFVGLAKFPSSLSRLYLLLARKGHLAWKLFLSVRTSAGAGHELVCMRDDDRRAAIVFGSLDFTSPSGADPAHKSKGRR